MAYSYTGVFPNQQLKNSGVFTVKDALNLEAVGEWGGSLELIEKQTVSGTPLTVDFDNIKSSKYNTHFITFNKVEGESTTAQDLRMRLSNDNGSSFESGSSYTYAALSGAASGTFSEEQSGGLTTSFVTVPDLDKETYSTLNGYVYLYNAGDSSLYTGYTCQNILFQTAVGTRWRNGGGSYNVAETINGLQLLTLSGGGCSGGVFKVYGVKQI